MNTAFLDSHNHLQDAQLAPHRDAILAELQGRNVARMVVNGTQESDWPAVQELARKSSMIVPSYGLHPWFVRERTEDWKKSLERHLGEAPAGVGEIGLDRWIEGYDLPQQEEVFLWQWRLAAERNLPVSVHCLQAWGRLLELLKREPRPKCGFLLHSYGGPKEMIPSFAALGAYFSVSGYFANERKARQLETFCHVPPERLLIETDAPDMLPPANLIEHPLADPAGKAVNNPANIAAIYRWFAGTMNESTEALASHVAQNFSRLFGGIVRK